MTVLIVLAKPSCCAPTTGNTSRRRSMPWPARTSARRRRLRNDFFGPHTLACEMCAGAHLAQATVSSPTAGAANGYANWSFRDGRRVTPSVPVVSAP